LPSDFRSCICAWSG